MTTFEELRRRGLLAQLTDEKEIEELVNAGKATFYIGFDPTADSLHVGHFMALCLMKRLQMAGNKPIVLIGGGTAMIGDPSGKTDMRKMMTPETIQHNVDCFKKQMSRFIDFSEDKAIVVNNADWLMNLNYVELLRDVGAHFSVNRMLSHECYKQRMERGLTFLEFNYMIMQSYDFMELFQKYGCNMQFGGDDQWANMLGGTELIRRKLGKDAYAMTITLLLNSEGKKMGKTEKGAVWLDPEKTTPYEFFQYWRNVADADVLKCIRMLTFLPLEEIDKMDSWEGAQLNTAKEILAFELTKLVHGEEEAAKAQAQARSLFSAGGAADAPEFVLTDADFTGGIVEGQIDIGSVMVKAGLVKSKSEARTAIQQGGVTVDDVKITDFKTSYTKADLAEGKLFRKGKKTFVVSIMPCTAKKMESYREDARTYGEKDTDAVLTTSELIRMIKSHGVSFDQMESEACDMPFGIGSGGGVIFGATGGVTEAVLRRLVDGHDIAKDPIAVKRKIGYLPEIPPLYYDMTVYEYLSFVFDLILLFDFFKTEVQNLFIGRLNLFVFE